MTAISSKEFADNPDKYFDLAVNEDVFIERDGEMFVVANNEKKKYPEFDDDSHRVMTVEDVLAEGYGGYAALSEYEEFLEPDEDFYNALSADEFRERLIDVVEKIDKKYAQNASHCPAESTWVF